MQYSFKLSFTLHYMPIHILHRKPAPKFLCNHTALCRHPLDFWRYPVVSKNFIWAKIHVKFWKFIRNRICNYKKRGCKTERQKQPSTRNVNGFLTKSTKMCTNVMDPLMTIKPQGSLVKNLKICYSTIKYIHDSSWPVFNRCWNNNLSSPVRI